MYAGLVGSAQKDNFMSNKGRLILILVLAVAFSTLLAWMAFHPRVSATIWHNPLIVMVILILCAAPIYPLLRTPSSAIAVTAADRSTDIPVCVPYWRFNPAHRDYLGLCGL